MSFCKVCGKEYYVDEENYICIHCKAEKGMLEGQELIDYNDMKREMDANKRCINLKEEFYNSKYSELKKKYVKDYHYKLGYEECARRATYCRDLNWNMPYDKETDIELKMSDGTVKKQMGFKKETWIKKHVYDLGYEYWNMISSILYREYALEHPKTVYFEHKDIIITDPCYIIEDEHDWLAKAESIKSGMCTGTLYGDWSCHVFDLETEKPIGQFCADAGMVCVYPLDEPLLDKKAVEDFKKKNWCATIIKDFTGDVSFVRHAGEENEYGNNDWLTVEGRGSVNFSSRQTGL
jgi:hypothetical protein